MCQLSLIQFYFLTFITLYVLHFQSTEIPISAIRANEVESWRELYFERFFLNKFKNLLFPHRLLPFFIL